jgi:glycosyltransferase involved in cell wall biosynthesis
MTSSTHQYDPIIVWVGRFSAHDGYGTAARLHLSALCEAGTPVVGVDIKSRSVVGGLADGLVQTARSGTDMTIRSIEPGRPITVIVHDRPDRYRHVAVAGRSQMVGYTYWETSSLPANWASWMLSMDRIWTSSHFNADAFERAGVPEWMIDVVPHPVDQLALDVATTRDQLRSRWPESTVFLSIVSSAVGRRDLNLLFEAFAMAFDAKDDVALVVKVPEAALDGVGDTLERAMLSMPARSSGRWPNLHVVPANLTREQLLRLHASVDCYVSCERGNGWDLPAFDSMAMGVPVVAANFGASTMFLDPDDSYVVNVGSKFVACDAAFNEWHPLYSGQYWPYVDPAALATELRRAHDAPADRAKMGAAAAQRISHTYDPASVAAEVLARASITHNSELRSSRPAEVRVSDKDIWTRFEGAPALAKHGRLHEAALAGLLLDPDFLQPRRPRDAWRAYKRATSFARAHDDVLAGTPLRQALSNAMAVRTTHPVRKATAIAGVRRRALTEAGRLGDREDLRELAAFVDGYHAAVKGATTNLAPEHVEQVWRSIETNFGLIRTPDADLARLRQLRDGYQGRVFILWNGSSPVGFDPSKLAGEFTFAVDEIQPPFDQIESTPTFYTLVGRRIEAAVVDEIVQLDARLRFVPERFRGVLPSSSNTYWYWTRSMGTHIEDQFERDITRGIPCHGTALVIAIQQAFYLGFRELILIGVDAEHAGDSASLDHPDVDDMHRMLRVMRKGVERHGGRLLDATVGGTLDVLEHVDSAELFR